MLFYYTFSIGFDQNSFRELLPGNHSSGKKVCVRQIGPDKSWDLGILESEDLEILETGRLEISKSWSLGMWTSWNPGLSELWNTEIVGS